MSDRSWIPKIEDSEIEGMSHIRPLVREGDELRTVVSHDPRGQSFAWATHMESVDEGSLRVIRRIVTYHSWAYYGFFKPSVAEVLAMIPPELRDEVTAFEVDGPDTASDLGRHHAAMDAGYHVAVTTLYGDQQQRLGENHG